LVVGGEPGLALAFFCGVEVGAFAPFGGDAVAAFGVAGVLAPRYQRRPVSVRVEGVRRQAEGTGGVPECGNMVAPWAWDRYRCPVGEVNSTVPSGSCCSLQPATKS
jgi:hypothetical protein